MLSHELKSRANDEGILPIGVRAKYERCCLMTWSSRENDEGILPIGLRAMLERCCLMTWSSRPNERERVFDEYSNKGMITVGKDNVGKSECSPTGLFQ